MLGLCGAIAFGNYTLTQGVGTNFGSIVVGGIQYAQQLICDPVTPGQCAAINSGGAVKVDNSAVTQPISAVSLPLPAGAATAAGLTTINTTLGTPMQSTGGTVTANAGTNLNTSLLALEAGGNLAQIVTDIGPPGATACASDTSSCNTNQQMQRLAQRLTSIVTALGSPFQAGGSIGNTAFGATQSGTWTVQPGNTANTTPWLVSASQAGTWNITNISGTVSLPTGASTSAKQPAIGTAGTASADILTVQGIASMTPLLVTLSGTNNINNISGTISLPTGASTSANQTNGGQKTQIVDASGNVIASTSNNLNVQCANCSGSGASAADEASFTAGTSVLAPGGGFFQTTATNNALTNLQQGMVQMTANRAFFTNLRNASGTEIGTNGNPIRNDPTGTTAQPVNGTVVVTQSTAANLNVTCANCSGSGASGTDEAAFTAGSSIFAPSGGFFQTTATSNPLTNGQWGTWQMTANRAGFINLRDASGAELGTSGNPVRNDPTGGTIQPISGTITVQQSSAGSLNANVGGLAASGASKAGNPVQIGAVFNTTQPTVTTGQAVEAQATARGARIVATGVDAFNVSQSTSSNLKAQVDPLTAASWGLGAFAAAMPANGQGIGLYDGTNMVRAKGDETSGLWVNIKAGAGSGGTALADQAAFTQGTTSITPIGCLTITSYTGLTSGHVGVLSCTTAGSLHTTIDNTTLAVTQSGSWSLAANQSVNVSQINAVTPLMGNGVTGTGSQRVTIASDNTAFSVNAIQSGTWNIGSITTLPALVAGSALIGKVGIDQTTPGTTNNVTVASNTAPVSTMNSASAAAGVTSANAYVFDDVSPTAITENSFGYGRMSANRNQYHTLRDAAGNERGMNVNVNNAGLVAIDQTTAGTTNGVQDAATSATGSAVAAKAIYIGANSAGNLTGLIQADSSAAISVSTATTTQIVALSSGKKIYVTSFDVVAAGTGNVTFVYGTGSSCGTGTTSLTGAYNLTAQSGIAKGSGLGPVLVVPASNALCVTTSAAVQMSGSTSYTQF